MQILQVLKIIPVKIWIIGALVIFLGLSAYQTFIGDRVGKRIETNSSEPLPSYEYSPPPSSAPAVSGSPVASAKASANPSPKPSASSVSLASPSPSAASSASSTSSNSNSVQLKSIDPANPAFGTTMTIKGVGFGSNQGVYNVYYNGQAQPYGGIQSWSDTEIKTNSPFFASGAEYQLEVRTSDGRKSNRLTVKSGDGQPYIESFSPSSAKPGSELVLKGGRFGGQGQVNFFLNYPNLSGSGQIVSWTDSEIRLTIPAGLESGKEYGVEVVSGGGGHSSFKYYTISN